MRSKLWRWTGPALILWAALTPYGLRAALTAAAIWYSPALARVAWRGAHRLIWWYRLGV